MSEQEHNEYMKNVKWKTSIWLAGSLGTILLTLAGIYYGLKGDIKDGRYDTKTQVQGVYYRLNSKIDSLQSSNDLQFQDIRQQLQAIPAAKTVIIRPSLPGKTVGLFTQRWVDGKLGFFPVK